MEEPAHLVLRDADAGVADRDVQLDFFALHVAVDGDDDLTLLGELDRIGQQVEEDLAQSTQVADHGRRQIVLQLVGELEALGRWPRARSRPARPRCIRPG